MTFYGQPPSATHYVVKFVLLVCLFLAFYFRFSAEMLFFAYSSIAALC